MRCPHAMLWGGTLLVATSITSLKLANHAVRHPHEISFEEYGQRSTPQQSVDDAATEILDGHYLDNSITERRFFEGTCSLDNIVVRQEWRSLSRAEKLAFVDAERCLMALPNATANPGAYDRFSDFQAAHQQGTNQTDGDIIHYTAIFLQWHRAQLQAHEDVLKSECNYTGTIPWWDEAMDAQSGNFFQSDMWDEDYFGGNGSGIENCVASGPFANRTLHVGPLETTTDYCFARKFNATKGLYYGARARVNDCYEFDDFLSFYGCMAYYPHIAGHQAVGGVMTDVDASPGDPVFYLHHNYVDRLYWQWQQIDPEERLYLIEGNTTINEPTTGWEPLTLDSTMSMYGIADDTIIRDVQNIQGGFLCYDFDY